MMSERAPSMTGAPGGTLRESYLQRLAEIRQGFERTGDGTAAIAERSSFTDHTIITLWKQTLLQAATGAGVAMAAVGGYGRGQLFPYSDVDLLILCADVAAEKRHRESIRQLSQMLWDIGLRLSATTRTIEECESLHPENAEFAFALLDARPLAGDAALLNRFVSHSLPLLLNRERDGFLKRTVELTRLRHKKYGDTLFHLEPNIKDCPGGLRDLHACSWLDRLLHAQRRGRSDGVQRQILTDDCHQAGRFLEALRCFLHYRAGRDDNTLYWQVQDAAAAAGIGMPQRIPEDPSTWMRSYFRHARSVDRMTQLLLEEADSQTSSIYQQVRRWRVQTRNGDYRVRNRVIVPREPLGPENAGSATFLFLGVAREGLRLGRNTEDTITSLLPYLGETLPEGAELWSFFRELLLGPFAGQALRTMHTLGVLELLIPEFHGIDALVVRDAYHRYTVDEHTFLVLDALHELEHSPSKTDQRFAGLLKELESPELLYFAVLMHDTGKGYSATEHTRESARMANAALERFEVPPEDRQKVIHLIAQHLEMSAAMRRDIFDGEALRAFADRIGTPELLRMLTLLTYADVKSVHPDALTTWKAEALWQLYIGSANYLDRSLDEERVESDADAAHITRVLTSNSDQGLEIVRFLGGLPRRYLRTRGAEEIRNHFNMASRLQSSPVEVTTRSIHDSFEVTVVTRDRPFLFSDIAGALAAEGMNIVKADAFSNASGTVVDSFRFADPFGTLSHNPQEISRFEQRVKDVIAGKRKLEEILKSRVEARLRRSRKRRVEMQFSFDDTSSSHSTLLQVIAQDTPGLLYIISRALAEHGCDIGVALIDTEGEQAIDVFYLTAGSAKLGAGLQRQLASSLESRLKSL
jgi:[protein-PII] uridylyltransferase